jgi:predicted GIY-YIG superfamily endonuclease
MQATAPSHDAPAGDAGSSPGTIRTDRNSPELLGEGICAIAELIPQPPPPGRPCCTYVVVAADGTVLYVGMTVDLRQRFAAHYGTDPARPRRMTQRARWWDQAATVEIAWWTSRQVAAIAEGQLIQEHEPVYNRNWHVDFPPSVDWCLSRYPDINPATRERITLRRTVDGLPA